MTAREILDDLDDDGSGRNAAFFPDFDHGYNYHVDARLSAYGDARRWAIVIEQVAVNPRAWHGGMHTTLYYHGNCIELPPQPGWGDKAVMTVETIADGPSGPLLIDENETVNVNATDIRIRRKVVPIRTDANYYWARNIDAEGPTHKQIDAWIEGVRRSMDPKAAEDQVRWYEENLRPKVGKFDLRSWDLLRGLVPEYRELLLATEQERREGLPGDLPLLLQLDDWEHPRLLEDEKPSSSESFKLIARVLATQDPKAYTFSGEGNVHWRNWPNSGSL